MSRRQVVGAIANAMAPGYATVQGPCLLAGLLIHYEGINQAGLTASLALITGILRGTLNTIEADDDVMAAVVDPFLMEEPSHLVTFWEHMRGSVGVTSIAAGKFSGDIIIPMGYPGDHNVLPLGAKESMTFRIPEIDPAGTALASCGAEITALIAPRGRHDYMPVFRDRTVQYGALMPYPLPEYTSCMIFSAPTGIGTDPDRVSILQGGTVVRFVDWDAESAAGRLLSHMEAAPTITGDMLIDLTDMGFDKSDIVGSGCQLLIHGGTVGAMLSTLQCAPATAKRQRLALKMSGVEDYAMISRSVGAGTSATATRSLVPALPVMPGSVISARQVHRRRHGIQLLKLQKRNRGMLARVQ